MSFNTHKHYEVDGEDIPTFGGYVCHEHKWISDTEDCPTCFINLMSPQSPTPSSSPLEKQSEEVTKGEREFWATVINEARFYDGSPSHMEGLIRRFKEIFKLSIHQSK